MQRDRERKKKQRKTGENRRNLNHVGIQNQEHDFDKEYGKNAGACIELRLSKLFRGNPEAEPYQMIDGLKGRQKEAEKQSKKQPKS